MSGTQSSEELVGAYLRAGPTGRVARVPYSNSHQQFLDHLSTHVRQPEVTTLEAVG